jgi:hypothetical protein
MNSLSLVLYLSKKAGVRSFMPELNKYSIFHSNKKPLLMDRYQKEIVVFYTDIPD